MASNGAKSLSPIISYRRAGVTAAYEIVRWHGRHRLFAKHQIVLHW